MAPDSRSDRHTRLILPGVAVFVPAIIYLLFGVLPMGRGLELSAYDTWFNLRGELSRPEDVAVVAIDLPSEESFGRYPDQWNERYGTRDLHAQLVRNLHRAGARVVAFDATFGDSYPEQDRAFIAAIEETGIVILGAKTDVQSSGGSVSRRLEDPVPPLDRAPIGIVDIQPDPVDGVIRSYPIAHEYLGEQVPQLGVQALKLYLGIPVDTPVETTSRGYRVGSWFIPRAPRGGMLINYLGFGEKVSHYSYANVVDSGDFDIGGWDLDQFDMLLQEGRLEGKAIFVGSTVVEHQDVWPTPFLQQAGSEGASLTAGVEIHANAFDTMLRRRFIRVVPEWANWLIVLVLTLLTVWLSSRLKAKWGGLVGVAVVLLTVGTAWVLFTRFSVWMWSAAPVLGVFLAYSGSTVSLYVLEVREKARIRGMFQQYVPPRVVNELLARPELLSLGGEERELSVMFSDVAGFTSISENLSPTELVSLLNEYLTDMTEIVVGHDGIIDKYEGDALMAEFGAPIPFQDHALKSCRAALEMQNRLAEMRSRWAEEGRPQLHARIGINTGVMLVGNLGSLHIMDYTVMGDNVNLAARLEGTNKVYGTRICISEMTRDAVASEIITRELDLIRVKGKTRPVRIYEVLETAGRGIPAGRENLVERFEAGLGYYRGREFAEARDIFADILEMDPDDGPSQRYLERSQRYIETPPPEDWDGVFTMTTK
ncbi:MAG: adenylate/guanylate cyclase domain-containing protein [bacterium]